VALKPAPILNDVAWENKKTSRAAFSYEITKEIRLVAGATQLLLDVSTFPMETR
jgi:hypothetical protein